MRYPGLDMKWVKYLLVKKVINDFYISMVLHTGKICSILFLPSLSVGES